MAPERYKSVTQVERSPLSRPASISRLRQHLPRMVMLQTCMRVFLEPSGASRRGFWTPSTLSAVSLPPTLPLY